MPDALHRAIIQSAMDGFWLLDNGGRILAANDAYARMSGYSVAELTSMSVRDLDVVDSPDTTEARTGRLMRDGEERFEARHRRRDGSTFDVDVAIQYRDIDGGRCVVFIRDISERRRVEEAQRTLLRRFDELAEHSRTVIWEVDAEGLYTYVSRACETVWGYAIEEIVGRLHFYDLHPAEGREAFREAALAVFAERGSVADLENAVVTKQGQVIWVSTNGVPVLSADGRLLGYRGTDTDITERRNSAAALRRNDALLRGIVDNLQDAYVRADGAGVVTMVSPSAARLYGYGSTDEMIGLPAADLYADPDARQAMLAGLMKHGHLEDVVGEARRRDGSRAWVSLNIQLLRDELGRVVSMEGMVRDISDRISAEAALIAAEDRYRSIFENATQGIFQTTPGGRILIANPALARIFGYDSPAQLLAEVVDVTHQSYVDPRRRDDLLRALERQDVVEGFEYEALRRDGTHIWVRQTVRAVRDAAGQVECYEGTLTEVTARRLAEEALRAHQARQDTMLANIGDVLVIIDQDGTNRYKSPNIERLFGWKPEEVVGQPAFDNVHPDDVAAGQAFIAALAATPGASGTHECRYRCRDGSYRWIAFTATNLLHDPDIRGILGNYHDISERRAAGEALRESEALLRESQRATHVGSYKLDVRGGRWTSSAELDRLFGIGPDNPRSVESWLELVHPDHREMMQRHLLDDVLGQHKAFDHEYQIVRANSGEARWVYGRGQLTFDEAGEPILMAGTIQDITNRHMAQEARRALSEQLAQAQKMESVGRLAGGVAHDFNNMLAVILGHVELAMDEVDETQPLHEDLVAIGEAARRSADLTKQLLAFARQQTVAPKVLDLNGTVAGMLRMLQRLIGEDIDLEWSPGAALWPVRMDPTQVDQILANLCVNARDAIEGIGRITIDTANSALDDDYVAAHPETAAGDYVRLTVRDTGRGMDQATLARLFEPFFTTKGLGQGTGLGLATVYGIVQQNHGAIEVTSEPQQGACFAVYLPRHHGAAATAVAAGLPEPVAGRGAVILVVEDEPGVLRLATRLLRAQGHTVLGAPNAGEALRLAAAQTAEIDLLLTDVIMPEMNGRDLAQALLADHPGLRCLYMSGYTADVISQRGLLNDDTHFLQKPFANMVLVAKVREVLELG